MSRYNLDVPCQLKSGEGHCFFAKFLVLHWVEEFRLSRMWVSLPPLVPILPDPLVNCMFQFPSWKTQLLHLC